MLDIVEDSLFWARVTVLASNWLSAASEIELRRHWVDDFIPTSMHRTNPAAEVRGTAWLEGHLQFDPEFEFLALIPWRVVNRDRDNIEIADIAIDFKRRSLEIVLRRTNPTPRR